MIPLLGCMVSLIYKGSGPAIVDLLAGQVPVMVESMLTSLPHIKAGKLHAIAITSAQRNPGAADIPTVAESGYAGYEAITWVGLLAPAATPGATLARLNTDISAILQSADVKERLRTMGATAGGGPPDEFSAYIRAETAKWAKVVKAAGLKAQ